MKLAEERHIAADPATVWAAVLNPQVLQACVPGCESLTGSPSEGFEAIVVQKVGPVKARFTGTVTLSEMVEAQSLRITGEGKGGVAGFAKGGAFVQGQVMPFARGGVVSQPTAFPMRGGTGLMGEAGPEAIMPLTRGPDGSLGVRASGGGQPVTVVMNITTPDVAGFARSQSQIAAGAMRALARGQRNR